MYYYSQKDTVGFSHSIDNVVIDYYLYCSIPVALEKLHAMGSERKTYWEKLNCSGCPKWSFYQNHIHYDDGIYLKIGHYTDYDAGKKIYRLLPMLSLEVNPNKHFEKPSFKEILGFVKEFCTSGVLIRYDYAIDIPQNPDSVQIFKSRKQYGLFKGTRYYGVRNNHGYCRIYDKAKEMELTTPLTRIEHVCVAKNKLSLEEFCYLVEDEKRDMSELTSVKRSLVMMALQIKAMGGDYSDALNVLERKRRYEIEPYLTGGYKKYEYDFELLEKLLQKIKELFFIEDVPVIETDENGFLQYDGESPFD